jgi:glucosyl-dolichyl phosphate glucuronosyltransferase
MRISIVIATYNRAPLLQNALEHLRHQQYEPGDEIVVVDNGSTDATADVITRAADGLPVPLVHLREPAQGKTPALIAGLAAARGDVLALTDDDVLVGTDWIEQMRGIFANPSIDLVGGRVDPIWERPAPSWLHIGDEDRYGHLASPLALLHYGEAQELGLRTAVGANLAVRRPVLEALGGIAPHLGRQRGTLLGGEDADLCQRAVAAGYRCEYHPELRVRHWVPAERMRVRYFLRWFFWSGVTHAVIEDSGGTAVPAWRAVSPYLIRQLAISSVAALVSWLAGRSPDAAAHATRAAFAAGYITRRITSRRQGGAGRLERTESLSGVRG